MLSADLVELVREHGGRRTQAAACRLAVTAAGVDDPRAAQSLEALSSGGPAESWHEVSQCLADEYDEAAWATHDAAEYASAFRRARAAAALAFAHADAAGDCVYEAAHAFDLPHDFAVALRAALSR